MMVSNERIVVKTKSPTLKTENWSTSILDLRLLGLPVTDQLYKFHHKPEVKLLLVSVLNYLKCNVLPFSTLFYDNVRYISLANCLSDSGKYPGSVKSSFIYGKFQETLQVLITALSTRYTPSFSASVSLSSMDIVRVTDFTKLRFWGGGARWNCSGALLLLLFLRDCISSLNSRGNFWASKHRIVGRLGMMIDKSMQ